MPPRTKRVQYGVTEPISFGGNDEYDQECTVSMEAYLQGTGENLRETAEQATHRETVICTLGSLLKTWIQSEYVLLGHSNADDSDDEEEMLKKKNVYFCTFGSYRLGVNAAGADIDALCVGPRIVGRDRFFEGLVPLLKNHSKISKLLAVPGAYVPVVKMCLDGIEIDLVYACINVDYVPENLNLLEDKLLFGLEEVDMRCLNGSRVTDMILSKLIPNPESFRATLVFLKFWAKRRAVHSNVMGFLPGVAISLLCARICQLYPDAQPAHLVHKFFHFYGKMWLWPHPIMLTEVYTHHRTDGSEFEVWDPKKNHLHSRDLMPILTPSFPSMNSTYTVSDSTLRIMKRELLRGFAITSSMYPSKSEERCTNLQKVWTELCQPSGFFAEYKVYLAVVIESASTLENHDSWKGFVTSKIRKFVGLLERSYPSVLFHPYPVPSHVELDTLPPPPPDTTTTSTTTTASTSTTTTSSTTSTPKTTSISSTAASASSSSSLLSSSTTSTTTTSPSLSSTPAPGEPLPKTIRDTYYIGVEPRTQGQTLYLADSIGYFMRMLEMEGQTPDMAANVEVIPAKKLRRMLKIPALRKKADGAKDEAKETAPSGESKTKDLGEDALPSVDTSLPPSDPAPQQTSKPVNVKRETGGIKRETGGVKRELKPASMTPKMGMESASPSVNGLESRGSPTKRKKEPDTIDVDSPNHKRTSNANNSTPSAKSIDPKIKSPAKPSITIVTTHFQPKTTSTKPASTPQRPLTEQEEKEAKAKRIAEKKEELARLRQQLAAPPVKAIDKSLSDSPRNQPSIPRSELVIADGLSPVLAPEVQNSLEATAHAKRLELLKERDKLAKQLAEVEEKLTKDVSGDGDVEIVEHCVTKRMRVDAKQEASFSSKITKTANLLPHSPALQSPLPRASSSPHTSTPSHTSSLMPPLSIGPSSLGSSSLSPSIVPTTVPCSAIPSSDSVLSPRIPTLASPKTSPRKIPSSEATIPKTKEEKKLELDRLRQRYAELANEKQRLAALPVSPVVVPASPVLEPMSPLVGALSSPSKTQAKVAHGR